MKGATRAADDLALLLVELTAELTVREMAQRYGGGRTMWSEYRCAARIIPLGRLNTVVRDRVRDGRGREEMLRRARRLYEAALIAEADAGPGPKLDEALRRAEADLVESERLVRSLLSIVTMLMKEPPGPRSATGSPQAGQDGRAAHGSRTREPEPEAPSHGFAERAFGQLGEMWAARQAARQLLADTKARYRALPAGDGRTADADGELTLALARIADALEHGRWETERLHQELRSELDSEGDREAHDGAPLEGVVLERTDRPLSAAAARPVTGTQTPSMAYDLAPRPVAGGGAVMAARPGPNRILLTGVAAAAVLAIAAIAMVAVVVVGQQRSAAPSAVKGAAERQLPGSRGAVRPSAPATPTPGPSTSPPQGGTLPGTSPSPTAAASPGLPASTAPTGNGASPSPSSSASPSGSPSATGDPRPGPTTVPSPSDGLLQLSNAGSRMCLSVPEGSSAPADGLIQASCGDSHEQRWHLTPESTGAADTVYSVRNRYSGLCLSVEAARVTNDARVTQYDCGDREGLFPDQFWTVRYHAASRTWQLVNVHSGKCASSRAGSRENEPVLQQDCREDPWLMWRI
nr:RICIN domain-containing protein [Streptomyces sp. NBC_00974]